jgi:hypothetical protein
VESREVILLTRDTATARVPTEDALCVYHESYVPPKQFPDAMPWSEFNERFLQLVDTRDTLVIVGLNRIITPANRVQVGGMVLRPRKWRRISVDTTLFRSEPWRAWFHFGCVGAPYHGYSYSYLAETDWKAFHEGKRAADPFSFEAIEQAGSGALRSEYERYFDLTVETVNVGAEFHREYAAEKARAFDEEHTISAIIKRLETFAQKALPWRTVPTPARLFAAGSHHIVRTDLKVDEFLVGRLQALADLTNKIAARFHGAD